MLTFVNPDGSALIHIQSNCVSLYLNSGPFCTLWHVHFLSVCFWHVQLPHLPHISECLMKRNLRRGDMRDMSLGQLQVISNDLHSQIQSEWRFDKYKHTHTHTQVGHTHHCPLAGKHLSLRYRRLRISSSHLPTDTGLNEELVQLLLIRDELHVEQDAMLVDIEDLTRWITLCSHPSLFCVFLSETYPSNSPRRALSCARSNVLPVSTATGTLTAISGTERRRPSLNKPHVSTCVRLHAILPLRSVDRHRCYSWSSICAECFPEKWIHHIPSVITQTYHIKCNAPQNVVECQRTSYGSTSLLSVWTLFFHFHSVWLIMPYFIELGDIKHYCISLTPDWPLHDFARYTLMLILGWSKRLLALFLRCLMTSRGHAWLHFVFSLSLYIKRSVSSFLHLFIITFTIGALCLFAVYHCISLLNTSYSLRCCHGKWWTLSKCAA